MLSRGCTIPRQVQSRQKHQCKDMSSNVNNPKLNKRQTLRFSLLGLLLLLVLSATVYGVVWYHRFYHHVTPQELSNEVKHSTFQTNIRGGVPVTLQIYQQEHATQQQLVLFTSGDGGWSPFCADIAAHIAASG